MRRGGTGTRRPPLNRPLAVVIMRTLPLSLALLFTLGLGGCSNASVAEAYGQPDPFEWTYFRGSPRDVVAAINVAFDQSGVRVESIRDEAGGTILTLSSRFGTAEFDQILVQSTDVEDYTARAQVYPQRDPLPRWLEAEVSGRI